MVGIHGEVGGCGEIGEKGELLTTYIRNEGCGFGDERVWDGDGGCGDGEAVMECWVDWIREKIWFE